MRQLFTLKRLFVLLLVFSASLQTIASNTLTISPSFYHIDHKKNIIIINQAAAGLNAGVRELKEHLQLDAPYAFVQPTYVVSTAQSYQVERQDSLYTVFFTSLPIVHVNTTHQIVDAPSVYATFSMSETSGAITTSNLGIEIRGGFSQSYPKKSYELSFWNDTTGAVSRDVKLLNMRTDNKWNLQALYNEPLRMSSKVSNELWQEMHQIYYKALEPDAKNGIAMSYVEVFVNDEYKGLYALSERIDRKQLKLKKYANGIKGELYKGSDWGGAVTFTSLPPFDNTSATWGGFEYKHPEEEINWTNLYNFVAFVQYSTHQDFYSQYAQWFKLDNAVDYYIFLNLLRATDNTGKNLYIARYKSGDPYYYVPWDLDGVFGTDWLGQQSNTTNDILSNGFYDRLIQDCAPNGFRATLNQRWAQLRATVITESHILNKFEANHTLLRNNNAYEREHRAWGTYTADSTQLDYTATWLRNRLSYLDGVFGQSCLALPTKAGQALSAFRLFPNPATDVLTVESEATSCELSIRDMSGKTVLSSVLQGKLHKLSLGHLPKGMYVVTLRSSQHVKTEKLVLD